MLVICRLEVKCVDFVNYFSQIISTLNLVAKLGEYLANLIFQRTHFHCRVLELCKGGEELLVDKIHKVIARHGIHHVDISVLVFRCCPLRPSVESRDYALVGCAIKFRLVLTVGFQVIEVFQEQEPRCLLDVVEFVAASSLISQYVVYCIKRCFVLHFLFEPLYAHHPFGSKGLICYAYNDFLGFQCQRVFAGKDNVKLLATNI